MVDMSLFDIFKKDKEYLSCEWLEYGIHFSPWGLEHCCMYAHRDKNYGVIYEFNEKNQYDFDDFFRKKKQVRNLHKKGKLSPFCKGCPLLQKKIWKNSFKITKMAFSTNTKCNCDCIYCYTHLNKKIYNMRPDIPVLYYIKKLIKENSIEKDCQIEFGGGEPVICGEFEELLNLFIDNNFKNIKIHSSGIQYSTAIERALNSDICVLIISPDAGTKDIYKKIKGVDKFDDVWNNIIKYYNSQNQRKNMVIIKYIILLNTNDSKELIDSFFNKIIEAGIQIIAIDTDMVWYAKNKNNETEIENLFKIVRYMENLAERKGIQYIHQAPIDCIVNEHTELYNKTKSGYEI